MMFQLVTGHQLNACDISTSVCEKVRLVPVCRQNHALYHILNIDKTGTFLYIQSEGLYNNKYRTVEILNIKFWAV